MSETAKVGGQRKATRLSGNIDAGIPSNTVIGWMDGLRGVSPQTPDAKWR